MPQFVNAREVETIYDAEKKRRVVIFERQDGTFGFVEDYFSDELLEMCWIQLSGYSNSFCDSLATVRREVYGRISWLREQQEAH